MRVAHTAAINDEEIRVAENSKIVFVDLNPIALLGLAALTETRGNDWRPAAEEVGAFHTGFYLDGSGATPLSRPVLTTVEFILFGAFNLPAVPEIEGATAKTIVIGPDTIVASYRVLCDKRYIVERRTFLPSNEEFWSAETDATRFLGQTPEDLLGLTTLYELRGGNWQAEDDHIDDFFCRFYPDVVT